MEHNSDLFDLQWPLGSLGLTSYIKYESSWSQNPEKFWKEYRLRFFLKYLRKSLYLLNINTLKWPPMYFFFISNLSNLYLRKSIPLLFELCKI